MSCNGNKKGSTQENVIELSEGDNFNDIINSDIPVMVDFYATWCGPCKKLSPILDEITKEQDGEMLLVKINVEQFQELSGSFGVRSIPTVIIFKQGKSVWSAVGLQDKSTLITAIENAK